MPRRRRKKKFQPEVGIPIKANRLLNGILIALVLILIRLWHVAIVQHEEKVEASCKPQRRVVVERADRASICDRFGVILAKNQVQYNAAIAYGDLKDIPRVEWSRVGGKKVKHLKRKEYISELAKKLAEELQLEAESVEDLIYAKASLQGNVPLVIKENISETVFFRLKMLEKDWPGIRAEQAPRRSYPNGLLAGEVIGFLGPITAPAYEAVIREIRSLKEYVQKVEEGEPLTPPTGYASFEEASLRLKELERKAYSLNDYVGKAGVEGAFDEELRGSIGKKVYLSDTRGNFLRELSGEDPEPGHRLYLSISAELQAYAEKLLLEYERVPFAINEINVIPEKQPWIKGGAVVVMDANSGEILTLASHPRFDPNDFIRGGDSIQKKQLRINHWLESETYLGQLWDLKQPLEREYSSLQGGYKKEQEWLDWKNFLLFNFPPHSPVREILIKKNTLKEAFYLQNNFERLLQLFSTSPPLSPAKILDFIYKNADEVSTGIIMTLQEKEFLEKRHEEVKKEVLHLKEIFYPYFSSLSLNYEKLLLVDLYRLVVDPSRFSPLLATAMEGQTLEEFRDLSARFVNVFEMIYKKSKELFHQKDFKQWREEHFKDFLAEKRREEKKEKRRFSRSYLDYLEEEEAKQFQEFWTLNGWTLLTGFFDESQKFDEEPLKGYHEALKSWKEEAIIQEGNEASLWVTHYQNLAPKLHEIDGSILQAYLRTLRGFEDLKRPLYGYYPSWKYQSSVLAEKHLAMSFYPSFGYGFARSHAFRQATTIGSLFKVVPAYEALYQRYKKMQEAEDFSRDLNPLVIVDDKHRTGKKGEGWNVGFTADGKPIPLYYHGGRLPRSDHKSIGRVDITKAMEVSSNPYFALLAGEVLDDPEDLCKAAAKLGFGKRTGIDLLGEFGGRLPSDITYNRTGLYSTAIGQHSLLCTPLQAALMLAAIGNGGEILKPQIVQRMEGKGEVKEIPREVKWEVDLPKPVRQLLLKGLQQVVKGEKGTARCLMGKFPAELTSALVGKTSTAEVVERFSLDGNCGRLKCKHVWFGAIYFSSEDYLHPELVVIVYLRFGQYGYKEAAPIAAKIVEKWHAIQAAHQTDSSAFSAKTI